jgi:3-oxoacyl-[acyl-carrier-protein] synthase II
MVDSAKPVILGYDLVSPLGGDLEEQWQKARAGQSGTGHLTRFPLWPGFPVTVAGQVPDLDLSPYPFLSPRALAMWPSPIFKHSMLVVHRALQKAGLEITPELAPQTAITFSPAVGGLDTVLSADRVLMTQGKLPKPYVNPNSCINMVTGKLAILTGATGPNLSTITACATGNTSLAVGAMLLASKQAKVVICGGVDFPLVEPIVAGFATMNGAYRMDQPEPPGRASRPFSLDRQGFVVAEGAACLILADRDFAQAHGLPALAELSGWAMTSDANHFVAPHLPTVSRCMSQAITAAGLQPADIQVVNAHAASTKVGDRVEAEALHQVFGRKIPPLCANKSQIGHTMGAASAIESIWSIHGLLNDTLLPTINYTPDPELDLPDLAPQAGYCPQEHVLNNAFGFGGTNCCLVFGRV